MSTYSRPPSCPRCWSGIPARPHGETHRVWSRPASGDDSRPRRSVPAVGARRCPRSTRPNALGKAVGRHRDGDGGPQDDRPLQPRDLRSDVACMGQLPRPISTPGAGRHEAVLAVEVSISSRSSEARCLPGRSRRPSVVRVRASRSPPPIDSVPVPGKYPARQNTLGPGAPAIVRPMTSPPGRAHLGR